MEGMAFPVLYPPHGSQKSVSPEDYCRTVSNLNLPIKKMQRGVLRLLMARVYRREGRTISADVDLPFFLSSIPDFSVLKNCSSV